MGKQLCVAKQTHFLSEGGKEFLVRGKMKILHGFRHQPVRDYAFIQLIPLSLPVISLLDMIDEPG